MKKLCILVAVVLVSATAAYPQNVEEDPRFRRFEVEWLTAALNRDESWFRRMADGKLAFQASVPAVLDSRNAALADLIRTDLPPTEFKVRITGTVQFITNDPEKNRSFRFLDTFNKKGGKWQVIAESVSPVGSTPTSEHAQIDAELLRLENARAQATVTNDRYTLDRTIAPEFVGTGSDGVIRSRYDWLKNRGYERVRTAKNTEMKVTIISTDLAVVTGVYVTTKPSAAGSDVVHRASFTNTWVHRDGQWQVVASHVSELQ